MCSGSTVRNFLHGFSDSIRGCWKVFSIDKGRSQASSVSGEGGADSSVHNPQQPPQQLQQPFTTLALRRLENRSKHKRDTSSQRPDSKPKALYVLFQCISLNLICILALNFVLLPTISLTTRFIIDLVYNRTDIVGTGGGGSSSQLSSSGETLHLSDKNSHLSAKKSQLSAEQQSQLYDYACTSVNTLLNALWVLPLFCITRLVNAIWFQDIANAAFRRSGRVNVQLSFSRNVADFCYAILLETIFLFQTCLAGLLPVPVCNVFLKFLHMSLLYALYAFEYVWMSQGVEMHQRLARIETNWPYFFGFGSSLSLITMYCSNDLFINGCLFGVCFPFLIVSSFEAKVPQSEFVPQQDDDNCSSLPIFAPSVYVSDKLSKFILRQAHARATTATTISSSSMTSSSRPTISTSTSSRPKR